MVAYIPLNTQCLQNFKDFYADMKLASGYLHIGVLVLRLSTILIGFVHSDKITKP